MSRVQERAEADQDDADRYVLTSVPCVSCQRAHTATSSVWDLRGGPLWLDREQWGIVTDALIEHRASATARKGANSASNSDVRAEMCVQIIQTINTAAAYHPMAVGDLADGERDEARVRALHVSEDNDRDAEWCVYDNQDWPCSTIRALKVPS